MKTIFTVALAFAVTSLGIAGPAAGSSLSVVSSPKYSEAADPGGYFEVASCVIAGNAKTPLSVYYHSQTSATWAYLGKTEMAIPGSVWCKAPQVLMKGGFKAPNKPGTYVFKLVDSTRGLTYPANSSFPSSGRLIVKSTSVQQPQQTLVQMPNLIGSVDGSVDDWLSWNGYKFWPFANIKSIGGNPRLSCLMSGRNYVLRQSPAPGATVPNSYSTKVTLWVDCEWR